MAAALACTCFAGSAFSQNAPTTGPIQAPTGLPGPAPQQQPETWLTRPTLTGDWGGLRTRLLSEGFDFRAGYVNEYAYNFSGGTGIGGDFAQQFAFGADIDLGKTIGLSGGAFHITFNAREGRSTSADFIGNKLAVQEVYGAGENFRLSEFSYAQDLADKKLNVKVGFYPMGNDFATTPILCSFRMSDFARILNPCRTTAAGPITRRPNGVAVYGPTSRMTSTRRSGFMTSTRATPIMTMA